LEKKLYHWFRDKLNISHGKNPPLLSMEGLRGLAVLLVFFVHYSAQITPWISGVSINISYFIQSFGQIGVDLFFVLSGYLIYGSIIDKKIFSIGKYAKRRAQRIYPVFLVVFTAYIVLSFIFPNESKLPESILDKIIYITQNLFLLPGLFDIKPIIIVAWSLSYEIFYYLMIPLVVRLFKLKTWVVDNRIYFWVMVTVISWVTYLVLGGHIRLIMFICGIILFELHSKKQFTLRKGGTRFLLIAITIFGLRSIFDISYALLIISIFILFLLLCLCAFNQQSNTYKWLTYLPLRWLGNMSYSYYLIHSLTLKFCFLVFGLVMPSGFNDGNLYFWFWIPTFALTIVVSFMLFCIVERPLSLCIRSDNN